MTSIRVTGLGRGPMKATGPMRTPRNLPPIKSVSPPITPPPGFSDGSAQDSTRSMDRIATPAPGSARSGFGTPRRIPEIHSGRVLHEKGMPLLCKVRLKTLKEMKDRLKEWMPLTGDRLDDMVESRVLDSITATGVKRAAREPCERWDAVVTEMEKNYELIAHVWNYVINHVHENEKKTLQSKFHTTVNKRFNVMLEPLQLNRRRQGNVGDMMLTAVAQTQEDMDSLSLELRNYKEFTARLSKLTDMPAADPDEAYVHDISVVYERLSGHIQELEREAESAKVELKLVKDSSKDLLVQLRSMKDKNSELQAQIEYFQKVTMANVQLQAKNTQLQEAIGDLKRDIAMGQSLMMQEIRSMREENRVRAEEDRERLMEDVQKQMKSAMVTRTERAERPPSAKKGGHSHAKRHVVKGSGKQG